jgi:hypothetical protein
MFDPAAAAVSAVFHPQRIETRPSDIADAAASTMAEEILPFTVRVVRNESALRKAVDIRHHAYARHLPDFAESLKSPEAADTEDGVIVLLAESKLDGSPLGTMRIQTNEYAPLCLEQSIVLPEPLRVQRLAEATRLGVTNDRGGRLVTTTLFKALYQYCLQESIDWMLVTGRAPVDRTYDRLLFSDVFPGAGYIPIHHVGGIPHRIMKFEIASAKSRWEASGHPLLGFMCFTSHPDIDVGLTRSSTGSAHSDDAAGNNTLKRSIPGLSNPAPRAY